MLIIDLERRELIKPPSFLGTNTHYLTRMGSVAYGVSTDNSDQDIYGVCIPPRDYIFPPNYIEGFDNRDLTFHQWQKHHVNDPSANGGKGCKYDFSIYSIVNYFKLAMENNPNVVDSLFSYREEVLHITRAFENIREHRKIFLHKGIVHKMKGYAFSELQKAKNCMPYLVNIRNFEEDHNIPHSTTNEESWAKFNLTASQYEEYTRLWTEGLKKTSRFPAQKIFGFDRKFCYHIFRLVDQAEYILINHDLDLKETGRVEKMKAIRRGDISFDEIISYFGEAEKRLANLYESSTLQYKPPVKQIRGLLLATLEDHYGSLANFVKEAECEKLAINEIREVFRKYSL